MLRVGESLRPATDMMNIRDVANLRDESSLRAAGVKESEIKGLKQAGKIDCQTCENRRYVDHSDDPGVSFQTPTKIDAAQSASAVLSHEMEHYSREGAKAKQEGKEVVSNSIKLFSAICPECGRPYVSGGETTTITKDKNKTEDENDYFYNKDFQDKIAPYLPENFEKFA